MYTLLCSFVFFFVFLAPFSQRLLLFIITFVFVFGFCLRLRLHRHCSNISKGGTYSLVIMDLTMPVLDGVHATEIMRRYMYHGTPFVALSASRSPSAELFNETVISETLILLIHFVLSISLTTILFSVYFWSDARCTSR